MTESRRRSALFSRHPDWTEDAFGMALGSTFTTAVLTVFVNICLIQAGSAFGQRINGGDCLTAMFFLLVVMGFGAGQWILLSILGLVCTFRTRPLVRGAGWGLLIGSLLTAIGYYLWLGSLLLERQR